MPLSAVIFDLDNTLADTMSVCVESYQHTLQTYLGQWMPAAQIAAEFGRSEEGILHTFLPDSDQQEVLAEYLRHYDRLHQPVRQPFAGVLPMLAMLKQRGVRVAIVTGKGEHSADISMDLLGLSPYVDRLEFGHADYNNKTENIKRVLEGWGIPPSEVAYVGDTSSDMEAAAAAGILPIGAGWGDTATVGEIYGAAHLFTSLEDFHAWVDQITRPSA